MWLLNAGADASAANGDGNTPPHYAHRRRQPALSVCLPRRRHRRGGDQLDGDMLLHFSFASADTWRV